MDDLFSGKYTRLILALVLVLVGGVVVVFPSKMVTLIGGNIYLWSGLVGAGFITAGWMAYRVLTGIQPKTAAYEAFLVASLISCVVILFNFTLGWLIPLFAAILIAFMAWRGLKTT